MPRKNQNYVQKDYMEDQEELWKDQVKTIILLMVQWQNELTNNSQCHLIAPSSLLTHTILLDCTHPGAIVLCASFSDVKLDHFCVILCCFNVAKRVSPCDSGWRVALKTVATDERYWML